jgi:hypothetical protein
MTASVRKQIVDMAIAQINTSAPSGVPAANDTRLESYQPSELPAITVFEIREEGESEKSSRWGYLIKRTFTLRIEIRVASDSDTVSSREAIDPIYVWVAQQTASAYQQPAFGGLAESCYETLLEWQYADSDQGYTLLQIDFRVEYSTLRNDPTKTQ